MQRIGRLSALVPVMIALACWILVRAPTPTTQAGPFAKNLDIADPAMTLTSAQRDAARALGEASRLVESGETVEARRVLDRVSGIAQLAGYAELVRVHLLMKEGDHGLAYRRASEAIDGPASDALRAALGVLQGEALAMAGDTSGAELAWSEVLGQPGARDEAVQNSIQLSIVAARQRTGSLDPARDPQVLLDQSYAEVAVASKEAPAAVLPAPIVLSRAATAFEAGRTERAIDLFEEAIAGKLDVEQLRVARMGRARGLFRARRYPEAAKAFEVLLPDVEARFWRARSLARLGDVEGAIEEFGRVSGESNEEFASWALYLMGTLHEGRDESAKAIAAFRGAAQYERFPGRVRLALWREGWAQYRSGAYTEANATLTQLVERLKDPLARLRPRYWSARAAALSGNEQPGRAELERIARDYPLTYYGWRAQERLSIADADRIKSEGSLVEGTRRIEDDEIERVALLIEADLEDLARDELRYAAVRAKGFSDRTRVGFLLARVGDYHRANRLVVNAYEDSLARGLQPGREALWWLSWPPAYRELIQEVVPSGASIDPELVWAIMREESHYRVDARSAVGALGLLQLMPATAAQLATEQGLDAFETEDLFDPRTNITLGSAYLAQLGTRFEGRMSAAIGSYNAGPNKVSTWLRGAAGRLDDDVWVENIPYDQTRGYVKRVLRSLHVYKVFYAIQ